MNTIKVVNWSESQVCIGCPFGEFVQSETLNSSNYICNHPYLIEQSEKCGKYTKDDYHDIMSDEISPKRINPNFIGDYEDR